MHTLSDRVAVVTGAGSGIGLATCEELARRGAHLALVDVAEGPLADAATRLSDGGRRVSTHLVDVADASQMAALPAQVLDAHGACHVLVNNAGVTSAGRFDEDTLEDLRWLVDINVWGVVYGTRAFLPALRAQDEAHIVNLSSMVGLLGLPQNVAYSLSKGAVRSFTEALRAELITTSVGVTAVFPGAINTAIMSSARGSEATRLAQMARSPLAPYLLRSPQAVARRLVAGVLRDRARVVVGVDAHVVDVLSRVLPGRSGLVGRAVARLTR